MGRAGLRTSGRQHKGSELLMKTGDSHTRVVILGSTGSIGRSTLNVVEHDGGKRLRTWGLSAHTSGTSLIEQARRFRPRFVTVTDRDSVELVRRELRGLDVEVLEGLDGVVRMVQDPATDRVLSAIVARRAWREPGRRSRLAKRWPWPTRKPWSSPDPR